MIAHLRVPFRVTGDHAELVEEDTLDEVMQNVTVIVGTFRGERKVVPDFGIPDPTFSLEPGADEVEEILAAIRAYEPRARPTVTSSPGLPGHRRIRVEVAI